ncbi:MAG: DUF4288 domain-containing protein [Bradymonadaceae bacterium]|nr:DUF4288 domain-containing protein [Lujinxingiaceae bacterium]
MTTEPTTNNLLEKYYFVILVSESSSTDNERAPLFEQSFLLIKADSQDHARQKVLDYAGQPHGFENKFGDRITWTLKQILDVRPVLYDSLDDVTELYARFVDDLGEAFTVSNDP